MQPPQNAEHAVDPHVASGAEGVAVNAAGAAARAEVAAVVARTAVEGPWRSGALTALARGGVLAHFLPADCGGSAAAEPMLLAILADLARVCLTTALAVSQWAAAVRILASGPPETRAVWLPPLATGANFTTVGISQLTTSRRHLATPALTAVEDAGGWRLDGLCPWVTGADSSDTIVTGAATPDGGQMFFVVATTAAGLTVDPPLELLALSGSRTSVVRFTGVRPCAVLPPPAAGGPRTGGLATTALAVGATRASVAVITDEARVRPLLTPIATGLEADAQRIWTRLHAAASTGIDPAARDALRADANSLVLRAAQAALAASKGAGFIAGHPVERLVRESLFFLVWSCPQAVTTAVLCELAGVADAPPAAMNRG